MSENNNSGSFAHAFLPGLILGLVIGAVAGAFLPDWIGGSKIPPVDADAPAVVTPRDGEPTPTQEEIERMIEEAEAADPEAGEEAGADGAVIPPAGAADPAG